MRDSKIRVFPFATVTRLQYGNHVVSSSLSFDCGGETSKRCASTVRYPNFSVQILHDQYRHHIL